MTQLAQRFFVLFDSYRPDAESRVVLLCDAAKRLGVEPVPVDRRRFDFSLWTSEKVRPIDMFYNATPFTHELDRVFINSPAASFHSSRPIANHIASSTQLNVALLQAGIAMPRTIIDGTSDRTLLREYVDYLGGFPLVIKVVGGSRGVGVMRVDSWQGLISLCDFLCSEHRDFILSQFIPNQGVTRAIVVGEEVVVAVKRISSEDDFRCSSPNRPSEQMLVSTTGEMQCLALAASKAVQFEFTGVDIVQDEHGNYLVIELNYPQDFVTPQSFSKVDVAFAAVSYLKNKAASQG